MKAKSPPLTPQELEIMKIVWKLGTATVRDVYEALRERRRIAYTTVMTMMKILADKRHLRRSQQGRTYVYEPTRSKNEVLRSMVREFVNRVFNGSAEPLLVHLLQDRQLSTEDLQKIQQMMEEE